MYWRVLRRCEVFCVAVYGYPITTSSTIMSTKPKAKPMVLKLECVPSDASGISSSTTTYSIAPAANASR